MKSVNILGFGTMGTQIAALFCCMGYETTVWNRSFAVERIKRFNVEKKLVKKYFGCDFSSSDIKFVESIDMLKPSITIEALPEDMGIKKCVFKSLPYDAVEIGFLTNSSSFAPEEIHPRACGLHFFNPLHTVKLVETTIKSGFDDLIADIIKFGINVVKVESNRGYVANYVLFREIVAALFLVENFGYNSQTIDTTLRSLGRNTSVFDVIDFVGVDVTKRILENLQAVDPSFKIPVLIERALSESILGNKNKTSIRAVVDDYARSNVSKLFEI